MEVINSNQSMFLPFWYILDDMFLTHETVDWVECISQTLITLKFNFKDAI
jgi:hypothetical protein